MEIFNCAIAGIVQFRIQLFLENRGILARRKRQAVSNEDIIENVSFIVREMYLKATNFSII